MSIMRIVVNVDTNLPCVISDQSLADISWLLSLLWHHSHQDVQGVDYFQQASESKDGKSVLGCNDGVYLIDSQCSCAESFGYHESH